MDGGTLNPGFGNGGGWTAQVEYVYSDIYSDIYSPYIQGELFALDDLRANGVLRTYLSFLALALAMGTVT